MNKKAIGVLSIIILLIGALLVGRYAFTEKDNGTNVEQKGSESIIFGTTTSLETTGVIDEIISGFKKEYPQYESTKIKVVPKGSGEVFKLAKTNDIDFMMTHSPKGEEELISEGTISKDYYSQIMENYFILVGPKELNVESITEAYKDIEKNNLLYISRGDESGTHVKEKNLLKLAGVTPSKDWYLETGQGMEETLRIANEKKAYTLTDIGTWFKLKDELKLQEGFNKNDKDVRNVYSNSIVLASLEDKNKEEILLDLYTYINSKKGRELIKNYKVEGKEIFTLI